MAKIKESIMDDTLIYEEIIKHMWLNIKLANRGYDTLTDEQKLIFNSIIGKQVGDRSV
jgi:hypothetical protein